MTTLLTEQIYYDNNQLQIEACSISSIAEQIPTPFYCYSKARLLTNITHCKAAFENYGIDIHYAMKANSNLHILRLMNQQGLGVDMVSAGEMRRAEAAGIPADRMIFSGVGKSETELRQAIETGIGQFNVESAEELALLASLMNEYTRPVNIALRVNPNVAVDTHKHITTGTKGNKFGIAASQALSLFRQYADHPLLNMNGLAMHIGSQICDTAPFHQAIFRLLELVNILEAEGMKINSLDLGGGFGIDYGDGQKLSFEAVVKTIAEATADYNGKVVVEPGRSLIADAGVLVSQVNYVKQAEPRSFLILDAAMNDLMRPALYQAVHPLVAANTTDYDSNAQSSELKSAELMNVDVVGPVCESTDTFARDYPVSSRTKAGDLMVFLCTGAYCSVMSSGYNSRDIIPEVMISNDEIQIIRQRITQDDLMKFEV